MKSFDRIIPPESEWWPRNKMNGPSSMHRETNESDTWNRKPGQRVRCVPWPEGAPDPSEVPQAGEKVTFDGDVLIVIHGIPEFSANTWYLWLHSGRHDRFARISEITPYVEEPERTYTEAQIREVYDYSPDELIEDLRRL